MEVVAEGLEVPWDLVIADDGTLFVTTRPGKIITLKDGVQTTIFTMDDPFYQDGEGGLLGLTLDPDFQENGYLYVYHTYREGRSIQNRVIRLIYKDGTASFDRVLLDGIPGARNHNGGRIRFGPDGYLYITAGDRYEPSMAQDPDSLGGKILRIAKDGSIPEDNPFPGSPIYSMGHRNPQGLAWHPVTGQLYASEHGQTAHDEINRIEPGANYGWPIIEGDRTAEGMKTPLIHSGQVTWAPSGMTFVESGPWKGKLVVAGLRGERLLVLTLDEDGDEVLLAESIAQGEWGRLRLVTNGPDGSLYVLTNNRDGRGIVRPGDDRILKLVFEE